MTDVTQAAYPRDSATLTVTFGLDVQSWPVADITETSFRSVGPLRRSGKPLTARLSFPDTVAMSVSARPHRVSVGGRQWFVVVGPESRGLMRVVARLASSSTATCSAQPVR